MKFDVFHSVGRIDTLPVQRTDRQVYGDFYAEAEAAEELGYGIMWVAESHFSSEVQKSHREPVIPNYRGEVGLNADSMQLAQALFQRTRRLGFGTAIMNIVGGNGGPIAAADRVRMLAWLNSLSSTPRELAVGFASGRFPYINQPFGIVPRDAVEQAVWPQVQQLIFVEATEIFLRLLRGETLSSADVGAQRITRALFRSDEAYAKAQAAVAAAGARLDGDGLPYTPRWTFEALKLVPEMAAAEQARHLRFVLGSGCPVARAKAFAYADPDVFNLSFTPPAELNAQHAALTKLCADGGRPPWHRSRMPRTVLVFIDRDPAVAAERASQCFDTYIEAMRGTAMVPDKGALTARALIGDSRQIIAQLAPDDPHGFHPDDRLMLWFEFNQADSAAVRAQMRQFALDVMPHYR